MSLIFVHLRWNGVDPDRYEEIVRAIPQGADLPPGCLSRQIRRQGAAVMATEAYDTEESGGRMDHLVVAMRAAGVEETPQTAMFSVPAMYAVAYSRSGRAADVRATIPTQRGVPESETLRAAPAASEAGAGG